MLLAPLAAAPDPSRDLSDRELATIGGGACMCENMIKCPLNADTMLDHECCGEPCKNTGQPSCGSGSCSIGGSSQSGHTFAVHLNGLASVTTYDFTFDTVGPSVCLFRRWIQWGERDTGFGPGWQWTYGILMQDSNSAVTFIDWQNVRHYVYQNVDGTFPAPLGPGSELVRNADHSLTLKLPQRIYTFQTPAQWPPDSTITARLARLEDNNNNALTLNWNNGQLTTLVDASNRTWTFTYATYGNGPGMGGSRIHTITTPANTTWTYDYDQQGYLTSVTDPAGRETTYSWQPSPDPDCTARRFITAIVGPDGGKTLLQLSTYGFDKITYPDGTSVSAHGPAGMQPSETDRNGNVTQHTASTTIDALGNATYREFDAEGKLLKTVDALGRQTTYTYDDEGNLTAVTDAAGNTTTYTYDSNNNLTAVTDPLGRTTSYTYDARGNMLSMTDALGNTTTYAYDERGLRVAMTDPLGHTTTYGYDAYGNLVSVTDPLGNTISYGYDLLGRRISSTDARGNTTTYVLDAVGRVTQIIYPDGATESFTYDCCHLASKTDANGNTTHYLYDVNNRLIAVTDALNNTTRYEYDANGNRTAVIDANGNRTSYQFDPLNRLVKIIYPDNTTESFAYDPVGNRVRKTDARGIVTQYEYDNLNRLIKSSAITQ